MSSADPFSVLEIERKGATLSDVKKAYARRLKIVRPDDDPAGFIALREAYDQARNIVRYAESVVDDEPSEASSEQAGRENDSEDDGSEEISYWYDEDLQLQLNSSSVGQLLEQFCRWALDEDKSSAEDFMAKLSAEPAFRNPKDFRALSTQLQYWVSEQADFDCYDYYDHFTNPPEITRPEWLSDDLIIAIEARFNWLQEQPSNPYEASVLNCIIELFEPTLLKHGHLDTSVTRHDVEAIHARHVEEESKDEYGSFYDRKNHEWVDMSPAAVALRDAEKLSETPWGSDNLDAWRELLNREELQVIDQFQSLNDRLRHFICQKTGLNDKDAPQRPRWLSARLICLLDDTFGWYNQHGRTYWEHEQYGWLHRIIAPHRQKPDIEPKFQNWETLDKKSFEYLGYQPMPWFLSGAALLAGYASFRALQTLTWLSL
ncbi:hypothetical protein [Coralliovum pocilloporae]|uniref:hypothetical protein n=1 Tax=Coralliovum pocilloporae TaxID=3066369 RepID=UPI003306A13D